MGKFSSGSVGPDDRELTRWVFMSFQMKVRGVVDREGGKRRVHKTPT